MVKVVNGIFWYSALAVIILDQLSKVVVEATRPTLGLLQYRQNTGAAFGILQGYNLWLAAVSLVVAAVLILNYSKLPTESLPRLLWGAFLGGVLGNFIDRAFRGYVVDFIDVGFWPAFNLADSALTISVIGLMIYYWKK